MKGKYKNLILDFGGVLYHIDYYLSVVKFGEIGFSNFDAWYSQAKQHELFDKLETGNISNENFYDEVRKISGLSLSDEAIATAWNALLLELPKERISLLKTLSQQFNLYLLSNTNRIHATAFKTQIEQHIGWDIFSEPFQRIYLSHEIGLRKPDAETFEFVINENRLNKEETLFVDDSFQHVEGARKCNIDAYFLNLKEGDSIERLVSKLM
jgi:putative hydrolase of the HAD superfamily